jgi:hypothetical protein
VCTRVPLGCVWTAALRRSRGNPHTHGTVDVVETVSSGARGASSSAVTYENKVAGRLFRFGRQNPGTREVVLPSSNKPQKE